MGFSITLIIKTNGQISTNLALKQRFAEIVAYGIKDVQYGSKELVKFEIRISF